MIRTAMDDFTGKRSSLRKIIRIIFNILLIVSLVLSIFIVAIQKVLLNPATYWQAFQEQALFENLPGIFSFYLFASGTPMSFGGNGQNAVSPSKGMDDLIQGFINTPQVLEQSSSVYKQTWDLLTLQNNTRVVYFDLSDLKGSLDGTSGREILRNLLTTLPPCSSDVILKILQYDPKDPQSKLPFCRPSDQISEILIPFLQPILQSMLSMIPNRINIIEMGTDENALWHIPAEYIKYYSRFHRTIFVIPVLAIIFLYLTIFLADPGKKSKLKAVAPPLLISGFLSLLVNVSLLIAINTVILNQLPTIIPKDLLFLLDSLEKIIQQIGSYFLLVAGLAGLAILGAGVISKAASEWQKN